MISCFSRTNLDEVIIVGCNLKHFGLIKYHALLVGIILFSSIVCSLVLYLLVHLKFTLSVSPCAISVI